MYVLSHQRLLMFINRGQCFLTEMVQGNHKLWDMHNKMCRNLATECKYHTIYTFVTFIPKSLAFTVVGKGLEVSGQRCNCLPGLDSNWTRACLASDHHSTEYKRDARPTHQLSALLYILHAWFNSSTLSSTVQTVRKQAYTSPGEKEGEHGEDEAFKLNRFQSAQDKED